MTTSSVAEGDGNKDWAEKAAKRYDQRAEKAEASGDAAAAKIFKRMAQIKRAAGAAAKSGKAFSWDEYHKLEGELNSLKNNQQKDFKKKSAKEGNKNHGHGFLKAAEEYTKKANTAMLAGDEGKASIYTELAEMKREASAAAAKGESYDWKRYFVLKKRLSSN